MSYDQIPAPDEDILAAVISSSADSAIELRIVLQSYNYACDIVDPVAMELPEMVGRYNILVVDLDNLIGSRTAYLQRLRRRHGLLLPVIVIESIDPHSVGLVSALNAGADFHISKPLSPRELVARAGTLLRSKVGE